MPPHKPKRRRRWIAAILCVFVAAFGADYLIYPVVAPIGGRSDDKGENGLWLRYTWYFGEKSKAEVAALGENLRERHIRYAYFHVRSVLGDGSLKYRFPNQARALNNSVHKANSEVKSIAWVYAGNRAGKGTVDLAQVSVRQRMVSDAVWLTTACGFDGVQWDYEICPSGDRGFLKLLDETRTAVPQGKVLSVAGECSYPGWLNRIGWSDSYIAEVAKRCDQLAVMCYDSGAYTPRLYVWFVQRQASIIPRIARRANPACQVVLGLPTYGPGGPSHNPRAENLRLALKAVREADGRPDGIALFADYTTDAAEWADYARFWSGNTGER